MPVSEVTTWRYAIPNTSEYEGWAILFLDSAGCFTTLSDYGNWAYRWNMIGQDPATGFRKFILRCDDSYLLGKIAPDREYDSEGSLLAVKDAILGLRREKQLDQEEARDEWEYLDACENLGNEYLFHRWHELTDIPEAWELHITRHPQQAAAFLQRCMPRLRELIKNDLGV